MSNTIQGSGLQGIANGVAMLEKSASQINETFKDVFNAIDEGAPIPDDVVSLSQAAVAMTMSQTQVEASVEVIKAYEELQGTLIDLVA